MKGRTVGISISDQGRVVEKIPLVEGTVLEWAGAGRKSLVTLVERPPFEGSLRIGLLEERTGESIRHILLCRKSPPLTASELILFTAPLPSEAYILKSSIDWEREVPAKEAREILKVLDEAHPPLVCKDGPAWLDGIGYEFRMRLQSFTIRMQWQVQAPRGWEFLETVARTMRDRAQVEAAVLELTEGERARVAKKLMEVYEEASRIRKSERRRRCPGRTKKFAAFMNHNAPREWPAPIAVATPQASGFSRRARGPSPTWFAPSAGGQYGAMTHACFAKTGSVVKNILADRLCSISPQNEISLGNFSGSRLKGGEARLPVDQERATVGALKEGWLNGLQCLSHPSGVAMVETSPPAGVQQSLPSRAAQ